MLITDNFEHYMEVKYGDKWNENNYYKQLGQKAFIDNPNTKSSWEKEQKLREKGEFYEYFPWGEENSIRLDNRYSNWSSGYSEAQREYYKTDEFEQKLADLCEEYNMDIDSGDGYQLKREENEN